MNKFWLGLFIFILTNNIGIAQYKTQSIFKNDTGQVLLFKLVESYKPPVVLDYGSARDTLYSRIYKVGDSISCIYSDYKLPLPEGVDPTTFLYMNGSNDGINAEHAYPQSKGAVGQAKSDMNHLFPVKSSVNEARSNMPFGESPDMETQKWFFKEKELDSIPLVNPDLYSELNTELFEPRESEKGNLARAIFYFFTMYKEEALQADPDFFNSQVNTLCQWHLLDPVDSLEWTRAEIISKYQGNRKNPFIVDCTLVSRTYCPNFPTNCDTSILTSTENLINLNVKVYPNPSDSNISFCLPENIIIKHIYVYSLSGSIVYSLENTINSNCIELDLINTNSSLSKGLYLAKIISKSETITNSTIIKFVIE